MENSCSFVPNMISKYREIVGQGTSSADDSRVQKRRTIEYDFLFYYGYPRGDNQRLCLNNAVENSCCFVPIDIEIPGNSGTGK